jgi:hypothetical protein
VRLGGLLQWELGGDREPHAVRGGEAEGGLGLRQSSSSGSSSLPPLASR